MERTEGCPSCGRGVFAEDAFCSWCGVNVQPRDLDAGASRRTFATTNISTAERSTCSSCNGPILPGDAFCATCGAHSGSGRSAGDLAGGQGSILEELKAASRGKYEFIREIGHGGMGIVYLAQDLELERLVAVKVLSPELLTDDAMVERFGREARTIASLRHESIVSVYGVGRAGDLHYFVMDYIEGASLSQIIRGKGPLSIDAARAILYQVGSALSYSHHPSRGVIHRDIKPSNILLDADGNSVVMDFGISKVSEGQSGLTRTGSLVGTPEYMSPEQCRGHTVAQASDQYSLGAVAFAMLTGAPPFTGPFYQVLVAHQSNELPDLRALRPDCPPELAEGIARMLAKPPGDRWSNIDDALAEMGLQPLHRKDPVRAELAALVKAAMDAQRTRAEFTELVTADQQTEGQAPTLLSSDEDGEAPTEIRILKMPAGIEAGDHFRLSASMLFADGAERPGEVVSWKSTDPSIVSVDPKTGELAAVGVGSARVTASAGGVSSSTSVDVRPPQVTAVVLDPPELRLELGDVHLVAAEPQGRSGEGLALPVLWSSSNPRTATVTERGEVTAHREGIASVLAHCEGVSGALYVEVIPATVVSVELTGAPESLAVGEVATLVAEPRGGRGQSLEKTVVWTSSNPDVATVDQEGRVETLAEGMVEIAAECGDHSSRVAIEVRPIPVARIEISTPPDQLWVTDTFHLEATAFDSRDRVLDRPVEWRVDDPDVLNLLAPGLFRAVEAGEATVTVEAEGKTTEVRLVVGVEEEEVEAVEALDPPDSLRQERDEATVASAQTVMEVAPAWRRHALWALPALALIALGTWLIPRLSDPAPPFVERVIITSSDGQLVEGDVALVEGDNIVFAGVAEGAGGVRFDDLVRWLSSDASVASVDSNGRVSAEAPGRAGITALVDSVRTEITLVVTARVDSVVIVAAEDRRAVPEALTLDRGQTRALRARVSDPRNAPLDRRVSWTSSAGAIASVDTTGAVTGVAEGTAMISASVDGVQDQVSITVVRELVVQVDQPTADRPTRDPPPTVVTPPPVTPDSAVVVIVLLGSYAYVTVDGELLDAAGTSANRPQRLVLLTGANQSHTLELRHPALPPLDTVFVLSPGDSIEIRKSLVGRDR
ncbi:MAG: Ig-like domain-containing protein [Gemmatimonadetes bacterium]|nr:Ig-like domain-containing protein [Gemmatimonadota bacterium]